MSTLFISHSSADNEEARRLQAALEEQGHRSVFLDLDPEKGIQAGVSWERTLYTKLRACRAVVALASDSYLRSQWCFAEVALARMEGKELFVLQIDPWSAETRMPSILTEEQFIDLRTNREEGYRRLWNGFKVKGIVPTEAREWRPDEPPYPGLRAFREEDAPIFFGRDEEIRAGGELLNRVRRQGHPRLVMVLGSSGSGKSSLVRAGIVPWLKRDPAQWLVVEPFRPGRQPARGLAASLSAALEDAGQTLGWEEIHRWLEPEGDAARPAGPPAAGDAEPTPAAARGRLLEALSAVEEELTAADEAVARSVRRLKRYLGGPKTATPGGADGPPSSGSPLAELAARLRLHAGQPEATLVLVIDQFEELLGHEAEHPASRFLTRLRAAVEAEDSALLVVGTMRSDYLGVLQRSVPFQGLGFKSLSVGPMSREGMRRIIVEPARLGGVQLEPGLPDLLLEDTETSDALPLLAFTLRMMWDRHHGDRLLRIDDYRRFGRLQGAIAQVADETYADVLDEIQEPAARDALARELRDAFLAMARPAAEGSGWSRQPVGWDRLSETVRPALELFVAPHRLLVKRPDGTVEVAHEALFRSWDRLEGWLDENAEGLLLRREIAVEAERWDGAESGEDKEPYLWRGGRLARALELREAGVLPLEDLDREFLGASEAAERARIEEEKERQRRKLRRAWTSAAVVFVFFVGAVALFFYARYQARVAAAGRLAALALAQKPGQLDRALLLSVEAYRTHDSPETRDSLLRTVQSGLVTTWRHHEGYVQSVAASPDGRYLASGGGRDGVVRLWRADADGPPAEPLIDLEPAIWSVAFSRDSAQLAAADDLGFVHRWQVGGGDAIGQPIDHRAPAYSVAFSPDGLLLVGGAGGSLRLWRPGEDDPVVDFEGHQNDVYSVAVSRDGRLVAAAGADGIVRLWQAAGGRPAAELPGHAGEVYSVAFSPTDDTLASAGLDGEVRLWRVPEAGRAGESAGLQGAPLRGHVGRAWSVVFSADGERVASAGDDGTVRLWSRRGTEWSARVTRGHDRWVRSVSFVPSGREAGSPAERLLSGGDDATVRLWSAGPRLATALPQQEEWVNAVAFPSAGPESRLASGGEDGVVRLWRGDGGALRAAPLGPALAGWVRSVSFSADGEVLAAGGQDVSVLLWQAPDSLTPGESLPHGGDVSDLALSADGDRLVTGEVEGPLRLWRRGQGGWAATTALLPPEEAVASVAVSPADDRFASGGQDGTVRLWRKRGDRLSFERLEFPADPGGQGIIQGVAFSPRGDRLATAGRSGSVHLWNVGDGSPLGEPLEGHTNATAVRFSPDGEMLASGGDEHVQLWQARTGRPLGDPLSGYGGQVRGLAFSADGRTLASAGGDGTVVLWNVDASSWTALACGAANRNLSCAEWRQLVGRGRYRRTCSNLPPAAGWPCRESARGAAPRPAGGAEASPRAGEPTPE